MASDLFMRWSTPPVAPAEFPQRATAFGQALAPSCVLSAARLYQTEGEAAASLEWYEVDGPEAAQPADLDRGMRLELMCDVGDAGHPAGWRYLVHTDIPDHIIDEYNEWYDKEHLPRLVAVPGIWRARRYRARTGGPRYLTAYDISESGSWETPEALVARKTPWTARMRDLFQNTHRAMCALKAAE